MSARARYGSGSIYVHPGRSGDYWYGRWYVDGKQVKRSLGLKRRQGSREGLTRPEAEAKLRKRIADERLPIRADALTVGIAAERMFKAMAAEPDKFKPTTLATYHSLYGTHLEKRFGGLALAAVTRRQVQDLVSKMRGDGKAPKTIRNAGLLLARVYAFALDEGWCKSTPVAAGDLPSVESDLDIRFLEPAELTALLDGIDPAASANASLQHALYLTAAMTGLRQGELFALRWRDVDWRAGKIRVRRNYVRGHKLTPKTKAGSRDVPLPATVAAELKRHRQASAYTAADALVFANPKGQKKDAYLDHSQVSRQLKKALAAAEVERPISFHGLRHTYGTRMAAAGVPMRSLQAWMGHARIATTEIYAGYAPSDGEAEQVEAAFA